MASLGQQRDAASEQPREGKREVGLQGSEANLGRDLADGQLVPEPVGQAIGVGLQGVPQQARSIEGARDGEKVAEALKIRHPLNEVPVQHEKTILVEEAQQPDRDAVG